MIVIPRSPFFQFFSTRSITQYLYRPHGGIEPLSSRPLVWGFNLEIWLLWAVCHHRCMQQDRTKNNPYVSSARNIISSGILTQLVRILASRLVVHGLSRNGEIVPAPWRLPMQRRHKCGKEQRSVVQVVDMRQGTLPCEPPLTVSSFSLRRTALP